jgi:hypothetical protein
VYFRPSACLASALGLCATIAHINNLSKEPPASPCAFIMPCDPALPLVDEPAPQRQHSPLFPRDLAGGTATSGVSGRVFSAMIPRAPEQPVQYWPILLNGVPTKT